MASNTFRVTTIAAAFVLASASCIHPHPDTREPVTDGELVITEQEIVDLHVRTAWEVIRAKAPMLMLRQNNAGQPTSVTRRGRSTIYLNDSALLFVDEVRVSDLRALDEIPASQVESIRVLSGLSATARYGTNASSGVILVRTRNAT